jgi:ribose transport system permease protein
MTAASVEPAAPAQPPLSSRIAKAFAFNRIGGVYVLLALIVLFSIWVPDTFPHWDTARQIMNNNAVTSMAGLALILPFAAGVFDLSVPYTMTLSGIMCAYTIVHTHLPLGVAIAIGLAAALGVGIINGIVVVVFKIDSLIGTLATGFLIQALIKWRTGSRVVTSGRLAGSFSRIARTKWLSVTVPVFYTLIIATVLWYLLEHTATGRRLYATGFNRDASRLAGVRTERLRFGSLVTSSFVAGIAGIVLMSSLGSGLSSAGDGYLLGAFAAVFLGATQLKEGRFNAWGTLIGVVLLGTGTTGLGLANQPQWVQDMFRGIALITSLALTGLQVRKAGTASMRSLLFRRRPPLPAGESQPEKKI